MDQFLFFITFFVVGHRAENGIFKRVSLKNKLAAVDLHRLISDVRRRVEHQITFEGNEKRTMYVLFR
jgi:peroxin-3